MLLNKISSKFKILALAICVSAQAQATDIAMEAAAAASVVGLMPQSMASRWADAGINVQVALGQTLTKSLLKVASGKLDSAVVPPLAFNALKNGSGPYKQFGKEKGSALAENVRSLFGFPGSSYHAITWADSGIESWRDAEGKRVYIGPPAGAGNAQISALASAGGLGQGDYEGMKAPWAAAAQAFQDGQFDVYVGAFPVGSQSIAEMSLQRPIRILGVPDEQRIPSAALGLGPIVIPKGTYPGQVNEQDINTYLTVMFLGVNKEMDDDVAYKLTKKYFESTKAIGESNSLLSHLYSADPFVGISAPLHPGAVRYYKEKGIKIPDDFMAD